jgi:hypothetical protein
VTKTKSNKKVLLIALLVLLIAITGAFIGTLARYITTNSVSDDAVVAKFKLDVPSTIDLFSDSYTNVEADSTGKKIIAPGTEGEYIFEVTGTSEVAYEISATVSVEYSAEWDNYAPLEFSLDGNTWINEAAFMTALEAVLDSEALEPNEPYTSTQTIYWKWPFHTSDENDVKDTAMGLKAATGTAPKVSVNFEVAAVQVD